MRDEGDDGHHPGELAALAELVEGGIAGKAPGYVEFLGLVVDMAEESMTRYVCQFVHEDNVREMSHVDFEPIDEELEDFLRDMVSRVDDRTGFAEDIDYRTPEYRALEELGFIAESHRYIDGGSSVRPTYAAIKYFDRKEKWEKGRKMEMAKGIGEKVVDRTTDLAAGVLSKLAGL